MNHQQSNAYLNPAMPLSKVHEDAMHGVSLARAALRQRDPKSADALQVGTEPDQQQKARVIEATREFLKRQHRSRRASNVRQ